MRQFKFFTLNFWTFISERERLREFVLEIKLTLAVEPFCLAKERSRVGCLHKMQRDRNDSIYCVYAKRLAVCCCSNKMR